MIFFFFHTSKVFSKKDLGCYSDVGIHIDTMESGDKDYQVTFKVYRLSKSVWIIMTLVILGGRAEESTRKCEYYGEFLKQLSQDHPGFKKDINLPNSQLTWLCPQTQLTSNRNWVKVSPSTLESAWCRIVQINIYLTSIESFTNSWSVSCARLATTKGVWWLEWSCPIFSEEERGYRYKMFTPSLQ